MNDRSYPSQYVWPFTLLDGTEVVLRPIRPEDEPLMRKFHQTLSDHSVYMRYFSALSLRFRVSHERLVQVCFADYDHQIALVAEHSDSSTREHRILGVVRLTRLTATDQNEAEVAIVVADPWQKQGLGRELLRRLVQVARQEKVSRLSAEILRDNITVQNLFQKAGFAVRGFADGSSVQALLDLR